MDSITVLGGAALGKGISESCFRNARENFDVDVLAWDNGTSDLGPELLGSNKLYETEQNTKRDLKKLLSFREPEDIPFIITTAIGAGSEYHVNKLTNLIEEVISENEMKSVDISKVFTDIDKGILRQKIDRNEVNQLDYETELTKQEVNQSAKIVGMIGPEPLIEPVARGADIVIAGRALDISPFCAVPIWKGFSKALSAHMAKILECGSFAAEPHSKPQEPLIGTVKEESFEVVPAHPEYHCTVERVSSHTLYEKSDPYNVHLPDAAVDISNSEYEQVDDKRVRSKGAVLTDKANYSILMEGVRKEGFRTIVVGGVVGPNVETIDDVIRESRDTLAKDADFPEDEYKLTFRKYGDGEIGLYDTAQTDSDTMPETRELGVVIDVVGADKDMSEDIASHARNHVLHHDFPGHNPSGNYALVKYDLIPVGPAYTWNVRHLLQLSDPLEICEFEEEVIQ